MCGISAIILADPNGAACPDLFESLGLLQHRGQVRKKKKKHPIHVKGI
jgi:glutamine phosphoribosylpyrophosphate amidotransferase